MRVILGVTGSISAYKAVDLMRLFQKNKHQVSVILTKAATQFISPLTFNTFSPGNVYTEMFTPHQDPLLHINICKEGDLLLIAPATANIIGKMASGIADDLLSTIFLAFDKRVIIAPAMNTAMYESLPVQENITKLKQRGVELIQPEEGSLACRVEGRGRLPTVEKIYQYCVSKKNV